MCPSWAALLLPFPQASDPRSVSGELFQDSRGHFWFHGSFGVHSPESMSCAVSSVSSGRHHFCHRLPPRPNPFPGWMTSLLNVFSQFLAVQQALSFLLSSFSSPQSLWWPHRVGLAILLSYLKPSFWFSPGKDKWSPCSFPDLCAPSVPGGLAVSDPVTTLYSCGSLGQGATAWGRVLASGPFDPGLSPLRSVLSSSFIE